MFFWWVICQNLPFNGLFAQQSIELIQLFSFYCFRVREQPPPKNSLVRKKMSCSDLKEIVTEIKKRRPILWCDENLFHWSNITPKIGEEEKVSFTFHWLYHCQEMNVLHRMRPGHSIRLEENQGKRTLGLCDNYFLLKKTWRTIRIETKSIS
jgi:hypothetical protein